MKAKWNVVTGTNGSTKMLLEGASKDSAKWYAKGFNRKAEELGKPHRARLEKVSPVECGVWLVIAHHLKDDDYTPYEILSIETNFNSARNVAIGVNSMTQETGLCADILDLNYFPKVGVHDIAEVKEKAFAYGHQLLDMADQLKPRKGTTKAKDKKIEEVAA